MLAEIFMLHLEAKSRVLHEALPSRCPQFVPFDMSSRVGDKIPARSASASDPDQGASQLGLESDLNSDAGASCAPAPLL